MILFLDLSLTQAANNWPNKKSKLLWKLQDAVDSSKLLEHRQVITNDLIDEYNQVALRVLHFNIQSIDRALIKKQSGVTCVVVMNDELSIY